MKEEPIRIEGLNTEQLEMLDIIWSMKSAEEHQEWLANLDDSELEMAMSLTILLALEVTDRAMSKDLKPIKNYLKKFQLK